MMKDKNTNKDFRCLLTEIFTLEDMSLIALRVMENTIGRMARTIEDSFSLECAMGGEFGK
jgi:hypothetical protein